MIGVASAVDAAGNASAILTHSGPTGDGAPRLLSRPGSAAPWAPAVTLPGRDLGGAKGPVVAAAGQGAAVAAWRSDTPKAYASIVAMVRDPGGTWDAPATVPPADANGVRHPAVAIDGAGRAVLAYNTGTRRTHLSINGGVAVALRARGASTFGTPVMVDPGKDASAPAVAIAGDGRGLVAWRSDGRLWEVDVDVDRGTVGTPRPLSSGGRLWNELRVAAGPGGAATVVARGTVGQDVALLALRRPAGGSFSGRAFQVVQRFPRASDTWVDSIALASDERGATTLTWSPEAFGRIDSSGMSVATAGESALAFERPRVLLALGARRFCTGPSLASTSGRAAIAWVCGTSKSYTFQSALLDGGRLVSAPTLAATAPGVPVGYFWKPTVQVGLDAAGATTLFLVRTDPVNAHKATTEHLLTTTSR
jgi:hypothetical protein